MKIEYLSESFSIKYVKVDHVIYKVSSQTEDAIAGLPLLI